MNRAVRFVIVLVVASVIFHFRTQQRRHDPAGSTPSMPLASELPSEHGPATLTEARQ